MEDSHHANILGHLILNMKSTVKIISMIVNNVNSNVTTYFILFIY